MRAALRCEVGVTEGFQVEVGLHQGTLLVAKVMNRLTDEVREESLRTTSFVNDIIVFGTIQGPSDWTTSKTAVPAHLKS